MRYVQHTVRKDGDYLLHLFFEAALQYTVCFVDDETLEIPEDESLRALYIQAELLHSPL